MRSDKRQARGMRAVHELGSAELRSRREALKLSQAGLAAKLGVTPNTVARWERGEVRIGNPERLSAALARIERAARGRTRRDSQAAPIAQSAGPAVVPPRLGHNLPVQLTSFVGREQVVSEIRSLLTASRLLTLVGPGGIGKTRLAIQVANQMVVDFPDGVWFVELGSTGDPAQVRQVVASVLRVPEQTGHPLGERLKNAVADRTLLVVLDNCEHLVDACAELADALLRAGPGLRIIATSREPLRIGAETLYPVSPLVVPPAGASATVLEVEHAEAISLFVQRARANRPVFSLTDENTGAVVEVCRRLDGIPLAIELAAANISFLSPEQMLDRLEDRFAFLSNGSRTGPLRQQSLTAAIEWSYGLLDSAEQRVFRYLSVFAGSVTLEAAEAVCGGDDLRLEAVDQSVGGLVAKSLLLAELQPGAPNCYRMLETVRAYGRQRLRADNRAETIGRRHAHYFADLAKQSLYEASPASWADRLTRQYDDLDAALGWLLEHDDVDRAQFIGAALSNVWRQRGLVSEGRPVLAKLLTLPSTAPSRARAAALLAAGYLATYQGDFSASARLLEECVDVASAVGNTRELPHALAYLADVDMLRGDWVRARGRLEAALDAARDLLDGWAEAMLSIRLAQVMQEEGNAEAADQLVHRALPTLRAERATRMVALGLQVLANAALSRGEHPHARRLLEESLATWKSVRGWKGVAVTLVELGRLADEEGRNGLAATHFAESVKLCQKLGDPWGLALGIDGFAILAARASAWDTAVRLLSAASGLRAESGAQLSPRQTAWTARTSAQVRLALSRERFMAAWEAGARMSVDETVRFALRSCDTEPGQRLTERERQVAALVARGCSNRQIAEALVVNTRTAEGHVSNVLAKLGLTSRTQLAAWVIENHLDLPPTAVADRAVEHEVA